MPVLSISAPRIVQTFTLRVRFIGISRARLALAAPLVRFGAWIAGCQCAIEVAGPTETADQA